MTKFRTLIVPTPDAPEARRIAQGIDPLNYSYMWRTPLSVTGDLPATHYISTGYVSDAFAVMAPCTEWQWQQDPADAQAPGQWVQTSYYPGRPDIVVQRCAEVDVEVTEAEVEALFSRADSSEQEPFVAMSRLGVQMVRATMDATPEPAAEPAPAPEPGSL